ncbi:MAG: alpha/beta hydrolase [Bacteroidota bacterium]
MEATDLYKNLELREVQIGDISVGLRQIGQGKDLVFLHGFPTHGYTWRKLIPKLSGHFTCHILDLPGLGDSKWTDTSDFSTKGQAGYVTSLLDELGIATYSLVAHDSGATIARAIAINHRQCVENLILLNTEIPHHRPPWIPFYQKIGLLPGVPQVIRLLLQQNWFLQSPMGFREFYADKSKLKIASNILPYIDAVIRSNQKTTGAFRYLKGIDWKLVDEFEHLHRKIKARTLLLWGTQDRTFPIRLGREMVPQFACEVEFKAIQNASLLPHEEQAEEVIQTILDFVERGGPTPR